MFLQCFSKYFRITGTDECLPKEGIQYSLLILISFEKHYNLLVRNLDKFDEYWKERFDSLLPIIRELERHWALPRYPEPVGEEVQNPLDKYDKEDAEECLKNAEKVLTVVKEFLKEKYGLEQGGGFITTAYTIIV